MKKKIKEMIPHREPFLFIDEINEITDSYIVASRYIDKDEVFFKGHYPNEPIMPGVLICESMLQAGALLMSSRMKKNNDNNVPVVTKVNDLKFRNIIKPGDTMKIEVNFLEKVSIAYYFKGKVRVNNKLCSSCNFVCTLVSK